MSWGKPTNPPANAGAPYTRDELDQAIALRDKGMRWRSVAERLGRAPDVLCSQVARYKKGQLKFLAEEHAKVCEEIAQEIIAGSSMSAVARRRNLHLSAVHTRLKRAGWDQETLQEARQS